MLVDGLGGLGRSIAQWMVDRGAKSIILVSRSGAQKPEAIQALDELIAEGARVIVFACDVADRSRLTAVVEECNKTLPPIRGVIQAAMNLRDAVFENISVEDWTASLRPKVQGSRCLYECLPKDLDFFIMLSSCVGISGNKGQANYAAGNTYQDALALYRRPQGLPVTSIDLTWMRGIGVVAESMDLRRATSAGHKNSASQLKCQLKEAVDFPTATLAVREAFVAQSAQLTGARKDGRGHHRTHPYTWCRQHYCS